MKRFFFGQYSHGSNVVNGFNCNLQIVELKFARNTFLIMH